MTPYLHTMPMPYMLLYYTTLDTQHNPHLPQHPYMMTNLHGLHPQMI